MSGFIHLNNPGADPAFPIGGGANPVGGANIRFCQIFQKLHEMLGPGGGRDGVPQGYPPDPPMLSHYLPVLVLLILSDVCCGTSRYRGSSTSFS